MMKKAICIILIVILSITSFPIVASASNSDNFYCQYSGSTTASYGYKPNCTFTINRIVGGKFKGNFSATNLGTYSFDEPVSGKAYFGQNSLTCIFTVNFYNGRYYSNIIATIDKLNGTCECYCEGSWHMEDFIMTGTKFNYPTGFEVSSEFDSYSEIAYNRTLR